MLILALSISTLACRNHPHFACSCGKIMEFCASVKVTLTNEGEETIKCFLLGIPQKLMQ